MKWLDFSYKFVGILLVLHRPLSRCLYVAVDFFDRLAAAAKKMRYIFEKALLEGKFCG